MKGFLVDFEGVAVEIGAVFVEHAACGGAVEWHSVFGLELRVAVGALQYGTVPVGVGGEAYLVAVGAGALESHKLGVGGATDEDALVAAVDGDGAADGHQGGEVGLVDVDGSSFAEGGVAEVVAGAGGHQQQAAGSQQQTIFHTENPHKRFSWRRWRRCGGSPC